MAKDHYEYDSLLKLIVIGDHAVGKTTLVRNYCKTTTKDHKYDMTIGIDFNTKIDSIPLINQKIKFQIWDTAGQERFKYVTRSYYRSVNGALIVYDVTKKESFDHIEFWLDELKKYSVDESKVELFLVANKIDMVSERVVSKEEGIKFAHDNKMMYFELSSIKDNSELIRDKIIAPLTIKILGSNVEKTKLMSSFEIDTEKINLTPSMINTKCC